MDSRPSRPVITIEAPEEFRRLSTRLAPGERKELYTGHVVANAGSYPANLVIFSPKTEEFEAMREAFFNGVTSNV